MAPQVVVTSWIRSLMRPERAPATANIEQEPNPLDRPQVGGSKMPAFWDERSMARNLSPDEVAALAGVPAEHRLHVSWTLFCIRNTEAYLGGQPLRVRVPVSPTERVPYVFKKPKDGVLTVRRPEPPRAPDFVLDAKADALIASLTRRWAFVDFKFDGPWNADELMKLHSALLALGPRELAHLRHITFMRGGEHETNAGEYRSHGEKGAVVYFDGTFSHDDEHFVGEGDPNSHGTIFHEIGHALQGWADRELWRQLMAATDEYNAAIERYNAAVTLFNAGKTNVDLEALHRAIEGPKRLFEDARARFEDDAPVRYFEARFKGHTPPTKYGEKNPKEYFADSYFLFKTEPKALEEYDKALYDFFASGDYLKYHRKNDKGEWAEVAVPGDGDAIAPSAAPPSAAPPETVPPVPVRAPVDVRPDSPRDRVPPQAV